VDWRRTVAGIDVAGADTEPDPEELAMLDRALGELPPALLDAARPRRIYRLPDGDAEVSAAAYSVGPDIYLVDRSFPPPDTGFVTFDLVRLLAHELTHVAQYRAVTTEGLPVGRGDPIAATQFVAGFATAAGWRRVPDGRWELPDPRGTTAYGASSPQEDMAESVAEVLTGFGDGVDTVRTGWVEDWLGAPASRLSGGRPWVLPGSVRFRSDQPLYDEDAVAAAAAGPVEAITFGLPATWHGDTAASITGELTRRGLRGTFTTIPDERVARLGGTFRRADGLAYRVEIWDFRRAPGYVDPPDREVVTYVVLWP